MFKRFERSRKADDENYKAVVKIMGQPVGFDLSDAAIKVKNLLLTVSIFLLCLVIGDIKVTGAVRFLGVNLEGFTGFKMIFGLSAAVAWVLIHYLWYAWEVFGEWRLRITGMRVARQKGSTQGYLEADHPEDPRQSTLYNWWVEQQYWPPRIEATIKKLETAAEQIKEQIDSSSIENFELHVGLQSVAELNTVVGALRQTQEKIIEFGSNSRIEYSLRRFDNWFWRVVNSQNMRVLIIDILFPLGVSAWALIVGINYLLSN